jgi:hypothetical protein
MFRMAIPDVQDAAGDKHCRYADKQARKKPDPESSRGHPIGGAM